MEQSQGTKKKTSPYPASPAITSVFRILEITVGNLTSTHQPIKTNFNSGSTPDFVQKPEKWHPIFHWKRSTSKYLFKRSNHGILQQLLSEKDQQKHVFFLGKMFLLKIRVFFVENSGHETLVKWDPTPPQPGAHCCGAHWECTGACLRGSNKGILCKIICSVLHP